jgi:hypothetical protein
MSAERVQGLELTLPAAILLSGTLYVIFSRLF